MDVNLVPETSGDAVAVPIIESTTSGRWRPLRSKAALLVIPVALFVLSIVTVNAQGPWNLYRYDPEYAYLLNSLNLLQLHSPGHTDHPGTTLQEFGAMVVFCKWTAGSLSGGAETLQRAVLSHPEDYLRLMGRRFGDSPPWYGALDRPDCLKM